MRLKLFGQMQAEDASGRSVLPRSRKTRAVLAILAMAAPRPVLRSHLTGLLWSKRGKEQAHASLRQAVHELHRALRPQAAMLLQVNRNHLALVAGRLWVDVRAFSGAQISGVEGQELFQLSLLDDLYGIDPAFDRWLAEERDRTVQRARTLGEATLATASEPLSRIASAERLLSIDATHEMAWRALISAHVDLGDHAAARLAFGRYTIALSHSGLIPPADLEAAIDDKQHLAPLSADRPKRSAQVKRVRLVVVPTRALDGEGAASPLPGLADEIMAAVSRFRWISCVAGADQTSQNLAGDFLLESTLQRSGHHIRIIMRLMDALDSGAVIWANTFDRAVDDTLAMQGELAALTAAQIDPELLLRQGDRIVAAEPRVPTAFDLTLRAIPAIYRIEATSFHTAGESLAAAIALDPGNAAAHAWWAYWHLFLVGQAWAKDPKAATRRAGELAERAVTLDPGDARAIALVGHVRGFLHKQAAEALALHEKALSLNPSLPLAWCFSGLTHSYLGNHDKAIEQISRAQILSPHDPHSFFFDMALMMPYYLRQDFEQAVALGRRAVELNPGFSSTYKGYLATLGHLGHKQEAARVLARLLTLEPDFCIRDAMERSPMTRPVDLALYAEGLRRAGLRES